MKLKHKMESPTPLTLQNQNATHAETPAKQKIAETKQTRQMTPEDDHMSSQNPQVK